MAAGGTFCDVCFIEFYGDDAGVQRRNHRRDTHGSWTYGEDVHALA
jgi:hypothetical protein